MNRPTHRLASRRSAALLLAGNGISLFGDGMFVVAIGFSVLATGGGAGALGTVLLAGVTAVLFGILPAGVAVDRLSRRWMMLGSDLVRGSTQLTVAALVVTHSPWWTLVPCSALFGLATATYQPASAALLAEAVPRRVLDGVNGALLALRGAGLVIGGSAAGAIVAHWGPSTVVVCDAVTFYACALCVLALRPARGDDEGEATDPVPPSARLDDLHDALGALREHRWLAHGLLLIMGFVVASYAPMQVVGPFAARSVAYRSGVPAAELFAWVAAANAAGMIAGGLCAITRPPLRLIVVVRVLLVAGAIGPLAFVVAPSPLLALPSFAATGAAMGLFSARWESVKQSRIDLAMLARIASIDWFAQLVAMVGGVAIAAAVSAVAGPRVVLYGMSGLGLMLAILTGASPALDAAFRALADRPTAEPIPIAGSA